MKNKRESTEYPDEAVPFRLHPFLPPGGSGDGNPVGPAGLSSQVSLDGFIVRDNGLIQISYFLRGGLEHILLPPVSAVPRRRDELWRTTCLEFFFAVEPPVSGNKGRKKGWNKAAAQNFIQDHGSSNNDSAVPRCLSSSGCHLPCSHADAGSETASSPYWEANLAPDLSWNVYAFSSYRQGMREENSVHVPRRRVIRTESCYTYHCEFSLEPFVAEYDVTSRFRFGVAAVLQGVDGELEYWALRHPGKKPDFHHAGSRILVC